MVEFLKAVLFGIVEGITEWLPISSTGHMILLNEFVKLEVSEEFWEMFLVVIQLGAILAVVFLFWDQIWPFGKKNNRHPVRRTGFLSYCKKDIWVLWFKIIAACLPAAVVGILFDEFFESLFYNSICVAVALIVFGVGFTFFLAIPVMLGASLLKVLKFGFSFNGNEIMVLATGMITAFLISVVVIRFLMGYIKKHDFKVFGWYRIVLGVVVLLYFSLSIS